MRNVVFFLSLMAASACLGGAATQPATRPAEPVSVRGRVSVGVGVDLQKPDLTRVVVYIESDPRLDSLPGPETVPVVSQKDKTFVPNFVVVQRGSRVEFPNWDHFDHNVFSRSKAAPAFDLDRYPYGSSKSRVFEKTGVVQVFCNIHPSMRAMIFVTPNRFFARADADGNFEIRGVPPGRYELVAWQERCEEKRVAIEVKEGAATETMLALEWSRQSVFANDPPRRRASYGVERGLGIKREKLDLPVVHDEHPAPAESKPEK